MTEKDQMEQEINDTVDKINREEDKGQVDDSLDFILLQSAFEKLLLSDALPTLSSLSGGSQAPGPSQDGSQNFIEEIHGFCLTDANHADAIQLALLKSPLEFLEVSWSCPKWNSEKQLKTLNDILSSSKNSLTLLKIDAFNLFKRTKIGSSNLTLSNLTQLHLTALADTEKLDPIAPKATNVRSKLPIVPHFINLEKAFPSLQTLILELPSTKFDKGSLKKYFPGDRLRLENFEAEGTNTIDVLPTVKNLAVDCKFVLSGLRALAKKFPNVTNILVKDVSDVFMNNDSVWFLPWERLATLELRGFSLGDKFQNLRGWDSFFTGFYSEICDNLTQFGKDEVNILEPKVVTKYRSVRDLQALQRLNIVFDHSKNAEWKLPKVGSGQKPPISHVTGLYGFRLMPQLKDVVFAYDFHQLNSPDFAAALKPLESFVKFAHHSINFQIK